MCSHVSKTRALVIECLDVYVVYGCNVISKSDTDFGRVLVPKCDTETVRDVMKPSDIVDHSKIDHSSAVQNGNC